MHHHPSLSSTLLPVLSNDLLAVTTDYHNDSPPLFQAASLLSRDHRELHVMRFPRLHVVMLLPIRLHGEIKRASPKSVQIHSNHSEN